MSDLVSVIMSTFNEEVSWIESSVNSILNQSYKKIELIIVLDNPNNSKISSFLKGKERSDSRIKIIYNSENIGLVKSLNKAICVSNGKYIARMDADDISKPTRIQAQLNYLKVHEIDFVFTGVDVINEKGEFQYKTNDNEVSLEKCKKILSISNISNHPTWFMKREIYEDLNGYRDINHCEDYDFLLRCLECNYLIAKMPENLLEYRIRKSSISNSNSLEQFIRSRELNKIYRAGKILDFDYVQKTLVKKVNINEREKTKFSEFNEILNQVINYLKLNKKTSAIFLIVKSLSTSKYAILKFYDLILYRVHLRKILGDRI